MIINTGVSVALCRLLLMLLLEASLTWPSRCAETIAVGLELTHRRPVTVRLNLKTKCPTSILVRLAVFSVMCDDEEGSKKVSNAGAAKV